MGEPFAYSREPVLGSEWKTESPERPSDIHKKRINFGKWVHERHSVRNTTT